MGGFWLHPVTFLLTGLVLIAGMQYEYYLMLRGAGIRAQMITGMSAGAVAYIMAALVVADILDQKFLLMPVPVILLIMILELYRRQERPFDSLAHTLFPLLYIVLPLSMLPFAAFAREGLPSLLNHTLPEFSPGIVIGFFILLWINDSGAYLTGITFGRHRLMERISPKKSWEGFIGGAVLAAIFAWLISDWLGVITKGQWIVVSVIISVAGTYGDLVESMLKRSIGVKDSGTIMPGHGGFLDRFDSTLFAFPLVILFITLFG